MSISIRRALSLAALGLMSGLTPGLALAHAGADHAHGLMAGFAHPFTGLDHLAAMLAVGLWSAHGARRWWAPPLAFAALLMVGALLAGAGLALPLVEPAIASSVLVLGAVLALRLRWPAWAMAALAGLFALFHGAAHGNELQGAPALLGMVLATAALHGLGLAAGRWLQRRRAGWTRLAGALLAAFGAGLLLGVA